MIKFGKKSHKFLFISLASWFVYHFLENSKSINSIIVQIQNSSSSRGFGLYLLFNIVKWILFIFGTFSLMMFLKVIFNKNKN
jgi:hypothetical protein